jgi:hypothetical protein
MLKYQKLHITYANPHDPADQITVDYLLRDTPVVEKWIDRVRLAQQSGYSIDDPQRFYGFGSLQEQIDSALTTINDLIQQLNRWINIDYDLKSVGDQNTLNRLHHIFETEHGLLDKKDSDPEFKQYLCDLNLAVHRCESVARGAHPRHVVTYFALPKTEVLDSSDYMYFESTVKFGTVYINYAEIGKTLYDLMMDNDSYIQPEAFQPFRHYSADFVVKFWNNPNANLTAELETYYNKHQDFFESQGYTWSDLARSIGSIPVADLDYSGDILQALETRKFVKAVDFS